MIAANVVMAARAAGMQIGVKGNDLLLKAPAAPSPTMLELLSRNKPAILFWLRPTDDGWTAEEWHTFFHERSGIAEFDGGLSRQLADAQAFSCCVSEWLNRNPVSSSPEQCLGCAGDEQPHNPLLPFDVENPGYAWLHPACWSQWLKNRRAQAGAALRNMGIRCRSTPPEFCWQKKRPA
jgi:hypothetical protein